MSRKLGPEVLRSHRIRTENGFYSTYMSGNGLDVGFKGSVKDAQPVLDTAIGIDTDFAGYDGITLPFENQSKDYVFSSHCLEHIENWQNAIREWYRVTKINGFIIIIVPHKYLYEKRRNLPSDFNSSHLRLYSPAALLLEVQAALEPNSYRIVKLEDNDEGYTYDIGPGIHCGGACEIVLILKRIVKPTWDLL